VKSVKTAKTALSGRPPETFDNGSLTPLAVDTKKSKSDKTAKAAKADCS